MSRIVAFALLALATLAGLLMVPAVTSPTLQAQQASVVTVTTSTTITATIPLTSDRSAFPAGSVSATCPADAILTGGGVRLSSFVSNGAGIQLRTTPAALLKGSFPNGNAWMAEAYSSADFTDSFGAIGGPAGTQYTITVYALCARGLSQANGPGLSTVAAAGPVREASDDKQVRLTSEQRQHQQRTNRSGRDDEHTEGNVMAVACEADPPTVTLANRDGSVTVVLAGDARRACSSVGVGDYAEADGQKENERLFYADDLSVAGN